MTDISVLLATALVACVPCAAYVLRVLLFNPHAPGPFGATSTFVKVGDTITRPANAFDQVRRFFGAYRVEIDDPSGVSYLAAIPARIAVWECPKCLSFWLAFPWSVGVGAYLVLNTGDLWTLMLLPLIHLQITWWTQFLVFLQLRIEG